VDRISRHLPRIRNHDPHGRKHWDRRSRRLPHHRWTFHLGHLPTTAHSASICDAFEGELNRKKRRGGRERRRGVEGKELSRAFEIPIYSFSPSTPCHSTANLRHFLSLGYGYFDGSVHVVSFVRIHRQFRLVSSRLFFLSLFSNLQLTPNLPYLLSSEYQ